MASLATKKKAPNLNLSPTLQLQRTLCSSARAAAPAKCLNCRLCNRAGIVVAHDYLVSGWAIALRNSTVARNHDRARNRSRRNRSPAGSKVVIISDGHTNLAAGNRALDVERDTAGTIVETESTRTSAGRIASLVTHLASVHSNRSAARLWRRGGGRRRDGIYVEHCVVADFVRREIGGADGKLVVVAGVRGIRCAAEMTGLKIERDAWRRKSFGRERVRRIASARIGRGRKRRPA